MVLCMEPRDGCPRCRKGEREGPGRLCSGCYAELRLAQREALQAGSGVES